MLCALLVLALLRPGSSDQVSPGQGVKSQPGVSSAWWSSAVYYRVLVDSFKDSDGDGLGDLIGAAKQLSYIRALGADAVILSPIVARSPDCSRPGVLDHAALDNRYGTLADLNVMMEKAKKLELKVVVSLPLQTVSESSEWFGASANRTNGYDDWILWRSGEADQPPMLEPGVEAWTWHEGRSSFWASNNNESLLNLCSEGVMAGLGAVQCAWLRRGVSGILLAPDFQDQGCAEKVVKKMAADAMSCSRAGNLDTPVILVESSQNPKVLSKYMSDGGVGANSVISMPWSSSDKRSAADVVMAVKGALIYAPTDTLPTWTTSFLTQSHPATYYGSEMVDAINLLTMIFPGAAIIRQGDELGSVDTVLEWASLENKCWPSQILASSAPFSWDASPNAGFSTEEPWLPLALNYRYANAKTQFNNEGSHAGLVRIAAAMRKSPAMGPHSEINRLGDSIAVLRWGAAGSLLVVANLGQDQSEVQLSRIPGLPLEMTVAVSSGGSSLATGSHVNVEKGLKLGAGEAVLLAGPPRHCGGPGPVDKITTRLAEGWQKLNKYFNN